MFEILSIAFFMFCDKTNLDIAALSSFGKHKTKCVPFINDCYIRVYFSLTIQFKAWIHNPCEVIIEFTVKPALSKSFEQLLLMTSSKLSYSMFISMFEN